MLGFISNNKLKNLQSEVLLASQSGACVTEWSLLNEYLASSNPKMMQKILQSNTNA